MHLLGVEGVPTGGDAGNLQSVSCHDCLYKLQYLACPHSMFKHGFFRDGRSSAVIRVRCRRRSR